MRRIDPKSPVKFNTARRTVNHVRGVVRGHDSYAPMDNYRSVDDVHPIKDAAKPTNDRVVLAKWEKTIIKKETHPARKKVPPTEAKSGK